jgi:hypothetical protein
MADLSMLKQQLHGSVKWIMGPANRIFNASPFA